MNDNCQRVICYDKKEFSVIINRQGFGSEKGESL